jgi:hypothetical protein
MSKVEQAHVEPPAGFETRSFAYLLTTTTTTTTTTDRPNVFCMQDFSHSTNFNPLPLLLGAGNT